MRRPEWPNLRRYLGPFGYITLFWPFLDPPPPCYAEVTLTPDPSLPLVTLMKIVTWKKTSLFSLLMRFIFHTTSFYIDTAQLKAFYHIKRNNLTTFNTH